LRVSVVGLNACLKSKKNNEPIAARYKSTLVTREDPRCNDCKKKSLPELASLRGRVDTSGS